MYELFKKQKFQGFVQTKLLCLFSVQLKAEGSDHVEKWLKKVPYNTERTKIKTKKLKKIYLLYLFNFTSLVTCESFNLS